MSRKKNSLPGTPLHPRMWPEHPWQGIHVNFAANFMNKTYAELQSLLATSG